WNASKSFKVPESLRLLFLNADYTSLRGAAPFLTSVQLSYRVDGGLDIKNGDAVFTSLPTLNHDTATDLWTRFGPAATGPLPLIRMLLSDESGTTFRWMGGVWAPYPYQAGSPLTLVNLTTTMSVISYLDVLRGGLDFRSLGEGTCPLQVMATNGMS